VEGSLKVKLLVRRGRLIDPTQDLDDECDLLIEDGVVSRVGAEMEADGAEIIDARGLVVCPGLVDMHVHLREPGREDEETIASGTAAAVHGGFTSVAAMPNTRPPVEGEEGVTFVLRKAAEAGLARVFPVAALSKGQEGKTLSEVGSAIRAGAVAISDDGYPVASSGLMRRALEYVRMFDRPVLAHCEDPGLSAGGVMNEGGMSTLLGLRGIPAASEEIELVRDIILAGVTASRLHVCHVSTAGSLEHIGRAKDAGLKVTCEATPHHLTLTDEAVKDYDTSVKMKPPLRGKADVAALRQAVAGGLVDAIASDHAPHSAEEKDQEFDRAPFGVIGLETALGVVLTSLYHEKVVTLPDLVRLLSTRPAAILGAPVGSLKVGKPADVTLFDPDAAWEIDPRDFLSKSRNTPFSGWKVKGRAITVIVEGRVLMMDGELRTSGAMS
jgi:dihydroorotase